MHERAGGVCDNAQLATMLGYSGVSNGSFRTRVTSAKMNGLIEDTDDRKLRVSARGRRVVAPITPVDGRNARVEAFLAVDLFKRVFDRYNGTTLPEQVGLRNSCSTSIRSCEIALVRLCASCSTLRTKRACSRRRATALEWSCPSVQSVA